MTLKPVDEPTEKMPLEQPLSDCRRSMKASSDCGERDAVAAEVVAPIVAGGERRSGRSWLAPG